MTVITRLTVFKQKLQELGWPEGPNLQVKVRWTAGDADHVRRYSTELVTFAPDVILGGRQSKCRGHAACEPLAADCVRLSGRSRWRWVR